MNLCLPYASVYMLALGLSDTQIGFTATIYMLSQVLFAFLSGPITDKMGRRTATAIFDFVGWSLPCLLWWRAEGFWFFVAAALLNGTQRVPMNAWDCLLVEDAEKSKITGIYSLVGICAQLSALFAPISAILFSRLTLVPAIRILYINAFIVMTIKVLLLYFFSRETGRGLIRMEETRGKSIFQLSIGYGGVLKIFLKSPGMIFALAITIIVGVVGMINTTFWQVIVSKKLLVADSLLPLFTALRSIIAIAFLFLLAPRLTRGLLKLPLVLGFCFFFVGQLMLIFTPPEGAPKYVFLSISLVFDGFGLGLLTMLASSLVALNVNAEERARAIAIQHMLIMAVTAPFGWIGGLLSNISRTLPFALNLCLLTCGILATMIYYKKPDHNVSGAVA